MRSLRLPLVAALLAVSLTPSTPAPGTAVPSLDAIVRAAFDTTLTPGLAVAVVRPGGAVWTASFGYADREAGRPVTATTRFYIASATKALTALAVARRAARGELDLDAPLSRALPRARFGPGVHGDSIRVRDLLTHTHGISSEGPISLRVAYTGEYTNDLILELLAQHGPASTGRAFNYSNLGYDLAGILLAPDSTGGWKAVVDREVLAPIGMRSTTALRSRVPANELAMPYELGPGGWERIPLGKQDANMGAAGGYFSTAEDLARLVALELRPEQSASGIPPDVIRDTQRLQAVQDRTFGPYHRFGWGLGWDLGTYDGDTLLHRFGAFAGFRPHVSFMPRHDIGVVVLVNGGGAASPLTDVVATAVYDVLRGRADAEARLETRLTDLRERNSKRVEAVRADREKRAARAKKLRLPNSAYAGRYVSPILGTLVLEERGGGLTARMGVAESPAEVVDAAKNQFHVRLFGGDDVLEAVVGARAARPDSVRLLGVSFARR